MKILEFKKPEEKTEKQILDEGGTITRSYRVFQINPTNQDEVMRQLENRQKL